MNYYKGYVKTKNKKCLEKFKGKDLHSYEDVKDLSEYAGVLADGIVLIDVDDPHQSEILMQIIEDQQIDCRVYQTTRGRHFLFKNSTLKKCGTNKKLACGLTADIKLGGRNSYEVIKFDGKERFIEWDCEEPAELPKWLTPVNTKTDFFNMEEGEGRNSALYAYILTLTGAGFSKEESRDVLKMINKYILKDALSDDELDTLSRDDAFPDEVFYDGKKFIHDAFARFLISNERICRINGQLRVYEDGQYLAGYRHIEARMLKHIPTLKAVQRTEVLKYLELIAPDEQEADARYIAFKNGIYDLVEGNLKPFDGNLIVTNKIPTDYNPEAYSTICDATMDKIACHDEAIRALLEEAIGYSFYRRNELSKAFFLTGEGANGKSTFLDMIKNLLGQENYSSLDMAELDERFSVATMAGKLANIGDDISDDFLQGRAIASFKKIVSGNEIKAEEKGQNPFFFNPYTKLYFSANALPRTRSKGFGAILRRLVIIPFNAHFSKDDADYDPYITWKLKSDEVMQYLARIGIEGLRRVLENRGFTESAKVDEAIEDYRIDNNPILLWLKEDIQDIKAEIWNQPTKEVHRKYRAFCINNGFSEMTLINFSRELCRQLRLTTRRDRRGAGGSLVSVYEPIRGDQ